MINADCTVLVCSCDKYADVVGPFAALYRKYWPDCPFETVLVTETDLGQSGFDRTIACGEGLNWCEMLVMALGSVFTSCFKNDDEKIADDDAEWREANTAWYKEQAARTEGGKNYYTTVVAPWDPSAQVLIHWFNDTTKTKNNLKPKFSSMVDVKYYLRLYNGTPIDSSYLSTSPADSVYRSVVTSNVEGWIIALTKMHVGDSCTVIVPYQQGYGSYERGELLKPYSNLVFDIKLVDIYKYKAN